MSDSRVILIVLDGCGAGPAPDAAEFGDIGANEGNTLVNTARAVGGLRIPTLRSLGLGDALPLVGGEARSHPVGNFGRLRPKSLGGKDTVTGHWEMMGVILEERFPTYPNGFPPEVIDSFCEAVGSGVLGNYPSSGTEILTKLGMEHVRTGKPIIYTSADSVFQIAAHEQVISLDRLYEMCHAARALLKPPHAVQRVIARPFLGSETIGFTRTAHRKDFPLPPPENTLDRLVESGIPCAAVGVVGEVFGRGFSWTKRTQANEEHYRATLEAMSGPSRFIFTNFEDFDMLYGHRNDSNGFANALETFDAYLKEILARLLPNDLLIITADHGNDPTTPSTDHSREYVPLITYSPTASGGRNLGDRDTLADIGASVAHLFDIEPMPVGVPFN